MKKHSSITIRIISIITLAAFVLTQSAPSYALRSVNAKESPEITKALASGMGHEGAQEHKSISAPAAPRTAPAAGAKAKGTGNTDISRRGAIKKLLFAGAGVAFGVLDNGRATRLKNEINSIAPNLSPYEKTMILKIREVLEDEKIPLIPVTAEWLSAKRGMFTDDNKEVALTEKNGLGRVAIYIDKEEYRLEPIAHEAVHALLVSAGYGRLEDSFSEGWYASLYEIVKKHPALSAAFTNLRDSLSGLYEDFLIDKDESYKRYVISGEFFAWVYGIAMSVDAKPKTAGEKELLDRVKKFIEHLEKAPRAKSMLRQYYNALNLPLPEVIQPRGGYHQVATAPAGATGTAANAAAQAEAASLDFAKKLHEVINNGTTKNDYEYFNSSSEKRTLILQPSLPDEDKANGRPAVAGKLNRNIYDVEIEKVYVGSILLINATKRPQTTLFTSGLATCAGVAIRAVDSNGDVYCGLGHLEYLEYGIDKNWKNLKVDIKTIHDYLKENGMRNIQYYIDYNPFTLGGRWVVRKFEKELRRVVADANAAFRFRTRKNSTFDPVMKFDDEDMMIVNSEIVAVVPEVQKDESIVCAWDDPNAIRKAAAEHHQIIAGMIKERMRSRRAARAEDSAVPETSPSAPPVRLQKLSWARAVGDGFERAVPVSGAADAGAGGRRLPIPEDLRSGFNEYGIVVTEPARRYALDRYQEAIRRVAECFKGSELVIGGSWARGAARIGIMPEGINSLQLLRSQLHKQNRHYAHELSGTAVLQVRDASGRRFDPAKLPSDVDLFLESPVWENLSERERSAIRKELNGLLEDIFEELGVSIQINYEPDKKDNRISVKDVMDKGLENCLFPAPRTADATGAKAGGMKGEAAKLGQCVTADTMLPVLLENRGQRLEVRLKPIVEVKPGEYVLSLNEATQEIEPHRINALLDMGVKPVYRLTTASGRSVKTTANHPYLKRTEYREQSTENTEWLKVSGLKAGDEIAVPSIEKLSAICPVADFNALNKNGFTFNIERSSMVSDAKTVSARRKVYQYFSADKRVVQSGVIIQFFVNAFLKLLRQGFKVAFAAWRKLNCVHNGVYVNPSSCLIFSKGTKPFFCASSMDFLSDRIKFGLRGSIDSILSISQPAGFTDLLWYSSVDILSTKASSVLESTSRRAKVSKMKTCGTPFLSTITPALESLPSLNTELGAILLKGITFADLSFAGRNFIHYKFITYKHTLSRLFSEQEAEAAQVTSAILWDRIASIEYIGYEHVYDIEVDGTHNFIANGIFAHNTYVNAEPRAAPAGGTAVNAKGVGDILLAAGLGVSLLTGGLQAAPQGQQQHIEYNQDMVQKMKKLLISGQVIDKQMVDSLKEAIKKGVVGMVSGPMGMEHDQGYDPVSVIIPLAEYRPDLVNEEILDILRAVLTKGSGKDSNELEVFDVYKSYVRALVYIAGHIPGLKEEIITMLTGMLNMDNLNKTIYQAIAYELVDNGFVTQKIADAIDSAAKREIQDTALMAKALEELARNWPKLVKQDSAAGLLRQLPGVETRYGLSHLEIYLSPYFKKATEFLNNSQDKNLITAERHSIAVAAYRWLKSNELPVDDEKNVAEAMDIILEQRRELSGIGLLSAKNRVAIVSYESENPESNDIYFNPEGWIDLARDCGVDKENIYTSRQWGQTKPGVLGGIESLLLQMKDNPRDLTLIFSVISDGKILPLGPRAELNIYYQELGDIFAKAAKAGVDLSRVRLVIDCCRSYNFRADLFKYMQQRGIKVFPPSVAVSNLDMPSHETIFLDSLKSVHTPDKPITFEDVLKAEAFSFEYSQDSAVFVNMDMQAKEEKIGALRAKKAGIENSIRSLNNISKLAVRGKREKLVQQISILKKRQYELEKEIRRLEQNRVIEISYNPGAESVTAAAAGDAPASAEPRAAPAAGTMLVITDDVPAARQQIPPKIQGRFDITYMEVSDSLSDLAGLRAKTSGFDKVVMCFTYNSGAASAVLANLFDINIIDVSTEAGRAVLANAFGESL